MIYILVALIAYLIGNITGSYIVSKLGFSEDIRTKGSGNAGTTNVLRTYGLLPGVLTLLIDVGKGYLAVYIASKLDATYGIYIAGLMAVVGHCWPIVLGFKGGKGVATSAGVIAYHVPSILSIVAVLFFLISYIGKIMSITSLSLAVIAVIYVFIKHPENTNLIIMVVLLAIIIFYKHRDNIKRIINGTENKISIKKG